MIYGVWIQQLRLLRYKVVGMISIQNFGELPWHWTDASDAGTIEVKDLRAGQHKVTIDLVDGNRQLFPGQAKTVTFTVPEIASHSL